MLQSIRERATGWIAWVVFVLITIPFALWGVNEYFGADQNPSVANVDGTEIGLQQFQQAYAEQRQRLRTALGPDFDESMLDPQLLRDRTLEQMVADEALLHAALDNGLRVSDQQVAATIRSESAFARDGVFSQDSYQAWLRTQGFTSASFEFRLRRNLLTEQLASGIARTAVLTEKSAARVAALLAQERSFAVLSLPLARFMDAPVAAASVEAYYAEHGDELVIPERVIAEYVLVSRADIAAGVTLDEAELERRYETEKANFVTAEQRKVSHILVQVAPDASESDVEAARQRVEALRDEVLAGRAFSEVAAESSEDPGSASLGGDLGLIARGVMDKAFEDAAFSQSEGVVGEPVKSAFGLHLILVTEIKPGGIKGYAEVREQLRSTYQQDQAEALFYEQVERLANLSFELPDSLEPAADTLGLEVQSVGPLSRDGDPDDEMFSRPELLRALFSEDVLGEGNNSQPVDLGDGRVVAMRVRERIPSARQTLDQARPGIEARLRREAAEASQREFAEALLERLRGGEAMSAVSTEASAEWVSHEDVLRGGGSGGVDADVLETAFRMPRPGGDDAVFDGTGTGGGAFALIALQRVSDAPADPALQTQLRQAVALGRGRLEFEAYVESIRNNAEVRIYDETLGNAL